MKIAVTGGLGFIGNYLTKQLLESGHDVLVLDVREDKVPEGADFRRLDITNLDQTLLSLGDIDVVYHLAGTVLDMARKNPHLSASLDILGTANVLEASVKKGVKKVVYASSFYVYDGLPAHENVDEKQRLDVFKAEIFGVGKLVGERLIIEYNRKYGLDYVLLRFGPAYGPNNRCSCLIYDFVMAGICGNPIVIWGSGQRKNQYTYVKDIAEGSMASLSSKNEVFNLVSPEQVTIRQIADLLVKKYGFTVKYDLNKPEGSSMPFMSSEKAIKELNWKPTPLDKGIEDTVKVLRASSHRP